jgi:hypothetical protein
VLTGFDRTFHCSLTKAQSAPTPLHLRSLPSNRHLVQPAACFPQLLVLPSQHLFGVQLCILVFVVDSSSSARCHHLHPSCSLLQRLGLGLLGFKLQAAWSPQEELLFALGMLEQYRMFRHMHERYLPKRRCGGLTQSLCSSSCSSSKSNGQGSCTAAT